MVQSLIGVPIRTKEVLARKYEYIFKGYNELDFPFPEIEETFDEIKNSIQIQLTEILHKIHDLNESVNKTSHVKMQLSALKHVQISLELVYDKIKSLTDGVEVVRQTESMKSVDIVKYPYGDCIRLCANFAEICDLKYRCVNRFNKFGPQSPYYDEASKDSNIFPEQEGFIEYLKVLEKQDYITSFNSLLNRATGQDYQTLIEAKLNDYTFPDRSHLIKLIYKNMDIPYQFQTPRYKHHLNEDLLYLDVILMPTMKSLDIEQLLKFRLYDMYAIGIATEAQFADEFNLSPSDFFYHDVKHSLDMIARNWITYLEQELSFSEGTQHFIRVKRDLDSHLNTYIQTLDQPLATELKRAINLLLFEVNHEEGYPYDYNGMIRSLELPNPFYGQKTVDFLVEKLTSIYFFFPQDSQPDKIFEFPIELLEVAKQILLKSLYICKKMAEMNEYKELPTGHWETTRGETQINPYLKLKGESDHKFSNKKIGNISLMFKSKQQTIESQDQLVNDKKPKL